MIHFINLSENIRKYLWKCLKGPYLFISMMDKNSKLTAKAFKGVVSWLKIETHNIEIFFLEDSNLEGLFKYLIPSSKLLNVQEYYEILPLIKEFILCSGKIAWHISETDKIVKNLGSQLMMIISSEEFQNDCNTNNIKDRNTKNSTQFYSQNSSHKNNIFRNQNGLNILWVLNEILEIYTLIIDKAQINSKKFVEDHQLKSLINKVYHLSKEEGLGPIKERCKQLK
mmetsp:Transcript_15766/g.13795  ORF Transcript_15766/g.13795 Transcript_15766/m.13795 type:complete len:226 (+) Transcript_15766:402-1079(+)